MGTGRGRGRGPGRRNEFPMDGRGGDESLLSVQGRGREGGDQYVPAHLNRLQQVLVTVLLHCSGGWAGGSGQPRAAARGGRAWWANAFALWRALQAPGNSSRRKGLHPHPLPFSPFLKERLDLQKAF